MGKSTKTEVTAETTAAEDTSAEETPEVEPEPTEAEDTEETPAAPEEAPPEETPEEPAPEQQERSGALVLCVKLDGSVQIHVLRPTEDQVETRSLNPEIESKIISLGDAIPVEDLPKEMVEGIKAGNEPDLAFAADSDEAQKLLNEARSQLASVTVEPPNVYVSAAK